RPQTGRTGGADPPRAEPGEDEWHRAVLSIGAVRWKRGAAASATALSRPHPHIRPPMSQPTEAATPTQHDDDAYQIDPSPGGSVMIQRHRPFLAYWHWQQHALCRGMDSSVFFSPSGEHGAEKREREKKARAVCRRCPVIQPCAWTAMSGPEP